MSRQMARQTFRFFNAWLAGPLLLFGFVGFLYYLDARHEAALELEATNCYLKGLDCSAPWQKHRTSETSP